MNWSHEIHRTEKFWPPLLRYRRGSARWIDAFFYVVLAILFATGAYSIATRAWSADGDGTYPEVEQAVALFCDSKDQVIQFDSLLHESKRAPDEALREINAGSEHPACAI